MEYLNAIFPSAVPSRNESLFLDDVTYMVSISYDAL